MMNNRLLRRSVGGALIGAAALGFILALAGLVALWQGEAGLRVSLLRWLDQSDTTLTTTLDSLALADRSLSQLDSTLSSIKTSLDDASRAVGDTTPTLKTLERAAGVEAPRVIKDTHSALRSAETAARGIDDLLTTLARIPFLGLGEYKPAVPLSVSLGRAAGSLDGLIPILVETQVELGTAAKNLDQVQIDFITMSSSLNQAQDNVKAARPLVTQYQTSLRAAQSDLRAMRASLPGWLTAAKWGGTLLLLWFAVAQLALLTQGLELLRRRVW